jgi:hypothetical protein
VKAEAAAAAAAREEAEATAKIAAEEAAAQKEAVEAKAVILANIRICVQVRGTLASSRARASALDIKAHRPRGKRKRRWRQRLH